MKPLLSWAAVLLAAFVAWSLLAFWLAVRPPRIAIPLRPADVGLRVEDVTIATDDGLRLAAWLVPRPGAPAVVLLHGYPAEKADMLPLAAALARDFAVLLPDLRSFGASEGRATTLGFRERGDLRRAIDLLAARGHAVVGTDGLALFVSGRVGELHFDPAHIDRVAWHHPAPVALRAVGNGRIEALPSLAAFAPIDRP